MKILVTGGTGYIGSHTCVSLLEKGHEVVIVDNLCNSSIEVIDKISAITGKKPTFYLGDIREEKVLNDIFENEEKSSTGRIEGIIHFAGLKAVGESVEKPIEYYQNNVQGTLNLCVAMEKYQVTNFVFSSSATVYGNQKPPFVEDMNTGGVTNPYGRTKLFCEEILKDYAASRNIHSEKRCHITLLRYFNPIGAHKSGILGEAPQGKPNNLMPYIQQVASGIRSHLDVFGNDYDTIDGTGVRDYIHVMDLAEGHVAALEKCLDTNCEREKSSSFVNIYNLGTGKGTSVLELVNAFQLTTGVEIPYMIKARRAGDIAVSYAEVERARTDLGWEAKRSIEDMCKDAWNFETQRTIQNR